jgi:hypothetical protein
MSLKLRKVGAVTQVEKALVNELNRLRDLSVGANFHASASALAPTGDPPVATVLSVTAANASDLPTCITLVNQLKGVLNVHFQDSYAHNTAVTSVVATADATDLATVQTLANALKAAYNTGGHLNQANVHFTTDGTNTIAAANASDLATSITLLNELKTDVNAHIAAALAGQHIELGPA